MRWLLDPKEQINLIAIMEMQANMYDCQICFAKIEFELCLWQGKMREMKYSYGHLSFVLHSHIQQIHELLMLLAGLGNKIYVYKRTQQT